jgi:BolA protein
MIRKMRIKDKLETLKPHFLKITDVSEEHADHFKDPLETHFIVNISAEALNHKSRIEQHKEIHRLLENEFQTGLHSLSIKVIK